MGDTHVLSGIRVCGVVRREQNRGEILAKKKAGNLTIYLNVHKKNDEDDTTPHYRGKMNVGNKNYEVSLWINGDISGIPIHLSGQVTERE